MKSAREPHLSAVISLDPSFQCELLRKRRWPKIPWGPPSLCCLPSLSFDLGISSMDTTNHQVFHYLELSGAPWDQTEEAGDSRIGKQTHGEQTAWSREDWVSLSCLYLSLGRVSGNGEGRGRHLCCLCGKNGQNAQTRTNKNNYNSDLYAASISFSKVGTTKVWATCTDASTFNTYSLTLKISLLHGLSQGHLEWCLGYFSVN